MLPQDDWSVDKKMGFPKFGEVTFVKTAEGSTEEEDTVAVSVSAA